MPMSTYALSLVKTSMNTVLDLIVLTQPLGCHHAPNGGIGGGGGGGPRVPQVGPTPAEQFCRAIKKDKDHYSEFNDEKQFDNFRRVTESVSLALMVLWMF